MTPNDLTLNQWYPIFDSTKLKRRKPVGITRLSERLVLWRDRSGAAVCMTDRCPHRAPQLSLGWVRDDCLGMSVSWTALRFRRPLRADSRQRDGQPVPGGFDLPPRPVREAHGLVCYWYGDSATEIPRFPEAADPGPRTSTVQRDYPVSFLRDGWAAEPLRGWLRSSTSSWCSRIRTCGCSRASSATILTLSRPIICSRRIARSLCISASANKRWTKRARGSIRSSSALPPSDAAG